MSLGHFGTGLRPVRQYSGIVLQVCVRPAIFYFQELRRGRQCLLGILGLASDQYVNILASCFKCACDRQSFTFKNSDVGASVPSAFFLGLASDQYVNIPASRLRCAGNLQSPLCHELGRGRQCLFGFFGTGLRPVTSIFWHLASGVRATCNLSELE